MKFVRWFLAALAVMTLAPIALLAQVADTAHVAVPPPPSHSILQSLLAMLLPVIVATLTFAGFEGLQKLIGWVDKLPAPIKQIAVGVLSYLLTAAAGLAGLHLSSTDIAGMNQADVSALISYGIANIFHLQGAAKAVAVATGAKVGP